MVVWRFTGYYRSPRDRARRWNWRCTDSGQTRIASLRTFPTFADCLSDAREHGYQQPHHLARFDRRYECEVLVPSGERGTLVPRPGEPQSDRRRDD